MKLRLLSLDALFEGGRMFVGATSVAYLLGKGQPIEIVSTLKLLQSVVIVGAEVPTGVLADLMGKRLSLAFSLLLSLAGFALYLIGNDLFSFCLAEVATALGLCFWSGCYEALATDELDLDRSAENASRFFFQNRTANLLAVMLCGFLGGFLGTRNLSYSYVAGALSCLASAAVLATISPRNQAPVANIQSEPLSKRFLAHTLSAIDTIRSSSSLKSAFTLAIGLNFLIQPLIHYWQPLFLESRVRNVTNGAGLGDIFLLYVATGAAMSWVCAKLSSSLTRFEGPWAVSLTLVLATSMMFLGSARSPLPLIAFFCVAQGVLVILQSMLTMKVSIGAPAGQRATAMSLLSLLSRVGSAGGLGASASILGALAYSTKKNTEVFRIFGTSAYIVTGAAAIALFLFHLWQGRGKRLPTNVTH